MNQAFIRKVAVALAAVALSVVSYAQVTTSSMNGKITDEAGEAIPGAAVIATHVASGTQYYAVTNNDGLYYVNGMRAGGPYSVEISCLGYKSVTFTDVTLQLAETYALNAKLTDASEALSEAVVISTRTSKFNTEQTGAATNISNTKIVALPTVSRSITDVTRLSPYGGNGMSFSGMDGRNSNFTVDGANFNNDFGLSDNLPGGGNPISIDAIEEVQVVVSPYDVRQTNFIGGGLNAITKSGTNTFKGSAYIYHRNENMRGDVVDGETISAARDKDRNTMYGFTLGGPIIKNKLFFFVNAEYTKIPTEVISWRASEDGQIDDTNYISRTTVSDLQRVSDFVKEKYGYDTGSYTNFPADEYNAKFLVRLDWNINERNHLALRYNYTGNRYWSAPNASSMDGGTRSAYGRVSRYSMSFANSMYSMNNTVHSASLDLNSRITNNISNQFLATFAKKDDLRGSTSDEFPFIDIQDGTGTNGNYMALGYELFTWNNAVHDDVVNIKDDLTLMLGSHKIMGGLSYEYKMADNAYMRNGTGYYRYSSVDDFINGASPEVVCLTYGYDGESNPAARVTTHTIGIYAQDEWTVSERFKLNYGVRIDDLIFDNSDLMTNAAIKAIDYYDADGNVRNIDTGKWPSNGLSVSPRVGFNWDPFGNKTLKVRGGTGLFSGRIPLVFFTNMPTNSGMVQYQAQLNAKNTDMSQFAGGLVTDANGKATIDALLQKLISMGYPSTITPEDGTVPSSISAVSPDFKMPQAWKTSLAFDYSLPFSFPATVTAEGIFTKMINDVTISDWSMMNSAGFTRFNGADNRPIFPATFRTGTKAFVLENTSRGYEWSGSLQFNATPVEGLDIMAAYTHLVHKDVTGMPGSAAESAFTYVPTTEGPNRIKLHNSQYTTPDRFVLSATHNDRHGNHYSIIYETWRGGYNYSYMMSNDMNGDGYNYDSIYIPTDEQVANGEFRFVSEDDATRFMDYVHKDSYLSKHQGEYAEAYSVYNPFVHRVDLSYKHDFKLRVGGNVNTLQLCFDVKNLLNLFNSSWGVSKQMNPTLNSGRILTYEGVDAEGYATFSTPSAVSGNTRIWTPVYAYGQCWYASVGIKYMFN